MNRLLVWSVRLALMAAGGACASDPSAPAQTLVVLRTDTAGDAVTRGEPGLPLAPGLRFRVVDGDGEAVRGARVWWGIDTGNGRLEAVESVTGNDGSVGAIWVLCTVAGDTQVVRLEVTARHRAGAASARAIAVPTRVAGLRFVAETTVVRVAVPARLGLDAVDPFGNHFTPDARYLTLRPGLTADSAGIVTAARRGFALVTASAGGITDTSVVHAVQVVRELLVYRDTVPFASIGQDQAIRVEMLDDQGRPVEDSIPVVVISDSTVAVARTADSVVLRSVGNGVAVALLAAGDVARSVVAVVRQRTATLDFAQPSLEFDALGDSVALEVLAHDSLGEPVKAPNIAWQSSDSAVAGVGASGVLGARANGYATIIARSYSGVVAQLPVTVSQQVTQVATEVAAIHFEALGATLGLDAVALDRLGTPVAGAVISYGVVDQDIATIDGSGTVVARSNGTTRVWAASGSDSAMVDVEVAQRPVVVRLTSDTLYFDALALEQMVSVIALDSLGSPVDPDLGGLTDMVVQVDDPAVAEVTGAGIIRAVGNGTTGVSFQVAGLTGGGVLVVEQIPASLSTVSAFGQPIVTLPVGASVPLACEVRDRLGSSIALDPDLVSSTAGTVVGSSCGTLQVQRSGVDTLTFRADQAEFTLPLVVAAAPIPESAVGGFLEVDSLPQGAPWAPTAFVNSRGQFEITFTVYRVEPPMTRSRGHLHRVVSTDGVTFRYDGVVLTHGDSVCGLEGHGIENVAVVPRADGAGWRMYYAAGSFDCYGWQVFSAVSQDGITWLKEPGIRLSNESPSPDAAPPYPVGEGMVVDQLPSGDWRMIAGTVEHLTPPPDQWVIAEWRSTNQLDWTYVGTLLAPRDMPTGGEDAAYSPTVVQIANGLWRMVFTADNRKTPGSPSSIWSAVSTDRRSWQVEGKLLGDDTTDLLYSSLFGNRLVYLRRDLGQPIRLGVATISMP